MTRLSRVVNTFCPLLGALTDDRGYRESAELERLKRLVLKWRNEFRPELKAEGYARAA